MRHWIPALLVASAVAAFPGSASAADTVRGVFVANGAVTQLHNVYVTVEHDADDEDLEYQVILVTDQPVALQDRVPARLKALAGAGRLHGVRILWRVGYDSVTAVPYHAAVSESGLAVIEHPTINVTRMDDRRMEARIHSKMVGQVWHYDATISAAIVKGGVLDAEAAAPERSTTVTPTTSRTSGAGGARNLKLELGKLDYEATDEDFVQAVADGNLRAVEIFLELGMSANAVASEDQPLLMHATGFCGSDAGSDRTAIILALIKAGADVRARNEVDSTALLDAVQQDCDMRVIDALLAAGADPNAKARGGATPILMAGWLKRDAMAARLRAAVKR